MGGIDRRKTRVAFRREVDLGDVEPRRAADRLGVDLAAAGDDDFVGPGGARRRFGERERFVDVARDQDALQPRKRGRGVTTTIVRPDSGPPID